MLKITCSLPCMDPWTLLGLHILFQSRFMRVQVEAFTCWYFKLPIMAISRIRPVITERVASVNLPQYLSTAWENQWCSGSASDSNAKGSGFEPRQGQGFSSSYETPEILGVTSFGWDDKPRSSVCTHSEHQARTIKILQSLCVSHKIVETYRNQHAQCILSDALQI
jgi:hypothetical protein